MPRSTFPSPGQHRTATAFREHLARVAPDLDCDVAVEAGGPLAQPLELRDRTLANRFCTHPMEGWDGQPDGTPSAHTLRRWRRFGRSGAKLVWGGEAFAVQQDGRANPAQLHVAPGADTQGGLRSLLDALHDGHRLIGEDPATLFVGLQLTHSGRFARDSAGAAAPRIGYRHPVLDARFGISADVTPLTDGELERIGQSYVAAARLARDAGFDFVDLKCCHGYLLHEMLGAKSRPGRYGGSLDNRTALFRSIVAGIRRACPGLEIAVRVSLADVFPHAPGPGHAGVADTAGLLPFDHGFGIDPGHPCDFDLTEGFAFLSQLQELDIRLVNATLGSPYYCPHLQRPAAYPPSDGYLPPRDPLYEVARHVRVTRACKRAFPGLVFAGTGYSYLQEWLPHVAQHEVREGFVDLVGLGRMLLSYPELPRDVLAGRTLDRKRICRTFSDCTTAPRNGMISGCYPLDPYYGERPEADTIRRLKRASREP